jgi:hypothetical protein
VPPGDAVHRRPRQDGFGGQPALARPRPAPPRPLTDADGFRRLEVITGVSWSSSIFHRSRRFGAAYALTLCHGADIGCG